MTRRPFNSIYTHGFLRVATCAPLVAVASPRRNLDETLKLAREASSQEVGLAVFPELGLSAYSNEDLFFQDALLAAVNESITELLRASCDLAASWRDTSSGESLVSALIQLPVRLVTLRCR